MARMQKGRIVVVSARLDDEELLHVVLKGLPREYIYISILSLEQEVIQTL